ncbi:MAG: nuclear transport factor 2 family protein [Chloroflexi bacterium]|nr:nuclear transport factor 2 family protein [Chloroflexota bacterium]
MINVVSDQQVLTRSQIAEIGEGIRNALAHYAHVTDDRNVEAVVASYSSDAVLESGGHRFSGHDEIRTHFSKSFSNSPHKDFTTNRHLLLNTEITPLSETEAEALTDFELVRFIDGSWKIVHVVRISDRFRWQNGAWVAHYRHITAPPT